MKQSVKLIHWTPRLLCILAIAFIGCFGLDSFTPERTLWQQLLAFLIHLIPCYFLTAVLIIAWKWELIGGLTFLAAGLGFSPYLFFHNYAINHSIWMSLIVLLILTVPFILAGLLFILSYKIKRQHTRH
ncbi:MAG: hypothetical protein Q8914_04930 [Bacteroidota bacterium]|nr:hypothetical protein [Bacteroidota bacterium]